MLAGLVMLWVNLVVKRAVSKEVLWRASKVALQKFRATKNEKFLELSNQLGWRALMKTLKARGKYF